MKDKKFILIFDRGYPSLEFIYYLNKLGVKYLFRIRNISYASEKKNMKTNDELVNLTKAFVKIEKLSNFRVMKLT